MGIVNAFGWIIVTMDFSYKEKYWPMLSKHVKAKHGNEEITDAIIVQETLKECFKILEEKFMKLIDEQNKASFYIFVHNFHENSIELWKRQLEGQRLPMDESEFAVIRRILKIVLEQGSANDLTGAENFGKEILERRVEFKKYLEELLYIGYWAISITDYIARSQLFPKSIGFKIQDDELNILTYAPYKYVYEYIDADIPKHNNSVEVNNIGKEFQDIWLKELGVDYNILGSIILEQEQNPGYRFTIVKHNELISTIVDKFKYDKTVVEDFYGGLTLSKDNKLDFEDCILRSQDIRRHIYRPILKLSIDKTDYWLIGMNKWLESLTSMTSNALPFGICPLEWKRHAPIDKYIKHLEHTHDKILEDPAVRLLQEKKIILDRNIESIKVKKGNNVNLLKQGVGEIDLIFLDITHQIIYVCECKHNRSRFDLFGWRRDYQNFKNSYEPQLKRKKEWIENNKSMILAHLEIVHGIEIEAQDKFEVKGFFLINAPTVYMYDCIYPTMTLHNLNELINNTYKPATFVYTDDKGKDHQIELPYFVNFDDLIDRLTKASI